MASNANQIHEQKLTRIEKAALFVVERVGTIGFFLFCVALATLPLIIPSLMPTVQYISSGYLQLILLPLILLGQNLQGRHAEARAEADFETNVQAEKDILTVLERLDKQDEQILKILRAIESK